MDALLGDLASRGVATIVGLFLLGATVVSLMRTVIVPRTLRSLIADTVARTVLVVTFGLARMRRSYRGRDAVLAWAGPSILLSQLISWLVLFLLSYGLILYGVGGQGIGDSLRQAGSSLLTLGFADVNTTDQTLVDFIAAATGPIVIALMIGFLPTIYSSYLTRETAVMGLSVASGAPAWGPEMLARHSLAGSLDQIDRDFRSWGELAAGMRMSHTMYPVLIWVRSSRADRHYAVSLLAILDAAALLVSLTTSLDRRPAFQVLVQGGQTMEVLYAGSLHRRARRRMLPRSGSEAATADGAEPRRLPGWNRRIIAVEMASDKDMQSGFGPDIVLSLHQREAGTIALSREDFDSAVQMLRSCGFPIERDLDEAWGQFAAARSRYEFAAYALCEALDAPPAPWSGPRRIPTPTIWPHRAVELVDIADEHQPGEGSDDTSSSDTSSDDTSSSDASSSDTSSSDDRGASDGSQEAR